MEDNNEVDFIEELLDVEELESKQAPCGADGGMHPFTWCHNHNETLVKDV